MLTSQISINGLWTSNPLWCYFGGWTGICHTVLSHLPISIEKPIANRWGPSTDPCPFPTSVSVHGAINNTFYKHCCSAYIFNKSVISTVISKREMTHGFESAVPTKPNTDVCNGVSIFIMLITRRVTGIYSHLNLIINNWWRNCWRWHCNVGWMFVDV